jgi:choline dehydrogenase-like flavoprotein
VTGQGFRGGTVLDADVVVIGSGAGGACAAARFAELGRRVILLEKGGWARGDALVQDEAKGTRRLLADAALRTTDDLAFTMLQGETAGGGTVVNWMMMLRLPEWVRAEWARRFGFDAAGLDAAYARVEAEVGAHEVSDHTPNNRLLLDGAAALGWHTTVGRINARGCRRCAFCSTGCQYGAKQDALEVWLPRAFARGATLYTDASVRRIERLEPGKRGKKRVMAVVRGPTGPIGLTVHAPTVVVAAGAVGTPVLLERSGMGGGGVGRWLRLHPTTAVIGVYDHPVVASDGAPMTATVDEHLHGRDGYGFWVQCPPLLPGLAAVALPGFGPAHEARMRQMPNIGAFIALTRDGGDADRDTGRVRARRAGGASITYTLGPADRANVVASMEAAARLHLAAGAREVSTLHTEPVIVRSEADLAHIRQRPVAPNTCGLFSAHVNGTVRMGTDPSTSGVTPDGERHGAPGIYVLDGSILPTGLGVNPQATILALATTLSERAAAAGA